MCSTSSGTILGWIPWYFKFLFPFHGFRTKNEIPGWLYWNNRCKLKTLFYHNNHNKCNRIFIFGTRRFPISFVKGCVLLNISYYEMICVNRLFYPFICEVRLRPNFKTGQISSAFIRKREMYKGTNNTWKNLFRFKQKDITSHKTHMFAHILAWGESFNIQSGLLWNLTLLIFLSNGALRRVTKTHYTFKYYKKKWRKKDDVYP